MVKRCLNTIVSRLKTSSPKTHVSPSNGSSIADALRPTFAFLNVFAVLWFVSLLTSLEDKVFCKAIMKIAKLI